MTEKVSDIIEDALKEITLLGAEAPVEASDAQDAIRYMNRMIAGWKADGMDLKYTAVNNVSDDVDIDDGAYEGVVWNLAARLWGLYADGNTIPADLAAKARGGLETIAKITVTFDDMEYPETLPTGRTSSMYVDVFFPGVDSE